MKHNKTYLALVLLGMAPPAALAQKANLNGTWKLNMAESFMGSEHPFSDYALTKRIELTADKLAITDIAVHPSVVNIPLPDSTITMEVAMDGKEHEIEAPASRPGGPPTKVEVRATWQGCALELRQLNNGLADYGKQRLFLSDDGSQLIDLVERHSLYGDSEQRLVFDKSQ